MIIIGGWCCEYDYWAQRQTKPIAPTRQNEAFHFFGEGEGATKSPPPVAQLSRAVLPVRTAGSHW